MNISQCVVAGLFLSIFCAVNQGQVDNKKVSVPDQAGASLGSSSSVIYFSKEKVDDMFVKGGILYDGIKNGTNYGIHLNHREVAGQAEEHTLDVDIMYVVNGSATLVTGGSIMEKKTIAPAEIRGKAIEGGETWHLTKGDVIIIPKSTPHWFKEVSGPFLNYIIKVR